MVREEREDTVVLWLCILILAWDCLLYAGFFGPAMMTCTLGYQDAYILSP